MCVGCCDWVVERDVGVVDVDWFGVVYVLGGEDGEYLYGEGFVDFDEVEFFVCDVGLLC